MFNREEPKSGGDIPDFKVTGRFKGAQRIFGVWNSWFSHSGVENSLIWRNIPPWWENFSCEKSQCYTLPSGVGRGLVAGWTWGTLIWLFWNLKSLHVFLVSEDQMPLVVTKDWPTRDKLGHTRGGGGSHLIFNNISQGGGGYSLMWPIQGRATGQGMVFGLSALNRVYNFRRVCPKQGLNLS